MVQPDVELIVLGLLRISRLVQAAWWAPTCFPCHSLPLRGLNAPRFLRCHRLADTNTAGYLACGLAVLKGPESLAAHLRADWSHPD